MNRLLGRSSRRYLTRHPWQLALAVLGVTLGVAVVVSVDLARGSAERAFALSTEAVVGRASHQIVAGPGGLDEILYLRLRLDLGLRSSAPVVEGQVALPDHPGQVLQLLGVDPFAEPPFRSHWRNLGRASDLDLAALVAEARTGALGAATARRLGLARDDSVEVRAGTRSARLRLVGLLEPEDELAQLALADLLITDIATAQELLGLSGRLSRIDLLLPEERVEEVRALLPEGVVLKETGSRDQALRQMTRAFQANLTALSLLALLVGMFLVYNTMTFLVVQRRGLIGTLRALGVTRRQVAGAVLGEALAIGALGTVLGLALGYALGHVFLGLVTRTINDLYFVLSVRELAVSPTALAKGLALGLAATVAAALWPAREAAAAPPRVALLRSHLERSRRGWVRFGALGGVLAILAGALLGAATRSVTGGFLSLFALILGCALLTPALTPLLMAAVKGPAGRAFGILGRFAARSVNANLSRTGVAIAALMMAVATMIGIGVMIASFRLSVAQWLDTMLQADLYVSVPGPAPGSTAALLPAALTDHIGALEGVATVSNARRLPALGDPGGAEIVAYRMAPRSYDGFRFLAGDPARIWPAFDEGRGVIVSEPLASRRGLGVGDEIALHTDGGPRSFTVLGIYQDYGSDRGVVAMSRATYQRHWDDPAVTGIGIYLEPGADAAAVEAALRRLLGPEQPLQVLASGAIREASLAVFDRTFAITEALRALAGAIAFLGVFSALMALQLERSREFGVLRASGLTPGQLWRLVMGETGLMGLTAGLLALPVGALMAAVLIHGINRRSFGWSMETHWGAEPFLQGLALALTAALLAGVYPAWRMGRTAPAAALRNE